MIELLTLGDSTIRRDGAECAGLTTQRQKVALLSYIAVEGPVDRGSLLTLFWPEREEEKARHSLSQALYALRKEVGQELVSVAGDRIGLVAGAVSVDVKELEAAGEAERWEEVVELYRGPFLSQFHLAGAPGFDEWQTRTRAWVGSLARKAFQRVIASRTAAADLAGALDAAWRWVWLEPLEDEGQHALIALLALSGERSAALDQFQAFRDRLARDLEVEPLEQTVALVEGIRAGALPESPLLAGAPPSEARAPQPPVTGAPTADELERLLQEELAPRLEVVRKLSESPTAHVYLAREPDLKRFVAVKVFSPKLAADPRARLRFEREVQAVASLTHPNIVALHWASALSNGLPFFVMGYVEGDSLAEKVKAEGELPVPRARRILAEVASALAAAHKRGIVHRAVQPANILYEDETGRALLADFGVAAILTTAEDRPIKITESGELVGDPAWISPEQLTAQEITGRSDVYSLGLLGYELLASARPYEATSRRELYTAHINQEPRRLSQLRPDVDPDLEDLLVNCLAKNPRHRPSAAHLARTLTALPSEKAPGSAAPPGALRRLVERWLPHR